MPVEATDSSGDAAFEDLKALTLQDSSGDLESDRIAGARRRRRQLRRHRDRQAPAACELRDSSGDIEVDEVSGDVDVLMDSSGDIEIAQVDGNVRVEQDSSGSIRVEDVKGSVDVDSDSSGDIYAGRVGRRFHGERGQLGQHRRTRRSAASVNGAAATSATDGRRIEAQAAAAAAARRRSACRRSIGPKLWRSKNSVSAATSGARRAQVGARDFERHVAGDLGEAAREERGFAMLDELRGELAGAAHRDVGHLVEVVVDLLERDEFLHERGGGLRRRRRGRP